MCKKMLQIKLHSQRSLNSLFLAWNNKPRNDSPDRVLSVSKDVNGGRWPTGGKSQKNLSKIKNIISKSDKRDVT